METPLKDSRTRSGSRVVTPEERAANEAAALQTVKNDRDARARRREADDKQKKSAGGGEDEEGGAGCAAPAAARGGEGGGGGSERAGAAWEAGSLNSEGEGDESDVETDDEKERDNVSSTPLPWRAPRGWHAHATAPRGPAHANRTLTPRTVGVFRSARRSLGR